MAPRDQKGTLRDGVGEQGAGPGFPDMDGGRTRQSLRPASADGVEQRPLSGRQAVPPAPGRFCEWLPLGTAGQALGKWWTGSGRRPHFRACS